VDEIGQRPAGDLGGGPAQDARQGRAGEADPEAGIERQDHIRSVLQQHPEPLLPGAEGGRDGPKPGRRLVDGVAQDAEVVRAGEAGAGGPVPNGDPAGRGDEPSGADRPGALPDQPGRDATGQERQDAVGVGAFVHAI
jgi:hypothetical protein